MGERVGTLVRGLNRENVLDPTFERERKQIFSKLGYLNNESKGKEGSEKPEFLERNVHLGVLPRNRADNTNSSSSSSQFFTSKIDKQLR